MLVKAGHYSIIWKSSVNTTETCDLQSGRLTWVTTLLLNTLISYDNIT